MDWTSIISLLVYIPETPRPLPISCGNRSSTVTECVRGAFWDIHHLVYYKITRFSSSKRPDAVVGYHMHAPGQPPGPLVKYEEASRHSHVNEFEFCSLCYALWSHLLHKRHPSNLQEFNKMGLYEYHSLVRITLVLVTLVNWKSLGRR